MTMLKKTHLTSSSVSSRLNPYSITYGIEELLWHNPVYSQPSFLLYSCHLKIKKNLCPSSPKKEKHQQQTMEKNTCNEYAEGILLSKEFIQIIKIGNL